MRSGRSSKSAVTDSGRDVRRGDEKPGITNLIDILSVATGETPERSRRATTNRLRAVQADVGEAVVELLAPVQERYAELRSDPRELERLLARGVPKARQASEPTLEAMYDRMGFVRSSSGRLFGAARPRGL